MMTPDRLAAEMRWLGLGTAGLDPQGRPCALLGTRLAIVESAHRIGGFPHVDMPEPLTVSVYPPSGPKWADQPERYWPGLTAKQALHRLAELT